MKIEISDDHIYTVDCKPYVSVTQVLQATGFIDARWFTEYGRERGSLVHQIVHWYILGELDESSVDPALQGYLDAWKLFVKDTGYHSKQVEVPMFHESLKFCGTPDDVGDLTIDDVCLDRKTGSISSWVGLQLAAYEILIGRPIKRFALQLKENGKYALKQFKDRTDRSIFLSALACVQWQLNNL